MKTYSLLIIFIWLMSSILTVSAANWQANPYDCPVEYNFVTCPGTKLQCGIEGGTSPYCYEPSLLSPAQNSTSDAGDTYNAGFSSGFFLNCEETDSDEPYCDSSPPTGDFWCNRDVTCYSTQYRQTRCIKGKWSNETGSAECRDCRSGRYNCFGNINCEATSTSNCNASSIPNTRYDTGTCFTNLTEIPVGYATCQCDPGYFECDGGIDDSDGCEHQDNAVCGVSNHGTKAPDECYSTSAANCTSVINSDCNDDDSDSNIETCNGAVDGCEIGSGDSCLNSTSTAGSNGTYESNQCYAAASGGNCTASGTLNTWLDCDDSDNDGNVYTCNVGNGCEVLNNSVCTVGSVSGTINMCSGGVGNCVVDDQDIATTGNEVGWSGTNPMLWLYQYGTGLIANWTGAGGYFWFDTNGNLDMSGKITSENITLRDNNICNETTCWTLQDLDTDTTIGNCSSEGSCGLITYDSELDYTGNNEITLNILNITGVDDNACTGTDKVSNVTFNNGNLQIVCSADQDSGGSMDYTNLAMTNISETWDNGFNITMGSDGWFKGMLNWSWLQNIPSYVKDWSLHFTHLSNFTDDILWTTNFNNTGDGRWLDDTTIGNCSVVGSCSDVAYMNYENNGNFIINGNLNISENNNISSDNNLSFKVKQYGFFKYLWESGTTFNLYEATNDNLIMDFTPIAGSPSWIFRYSGSNIFSILSTGVFFNNDFGFSQGVSEPKIYQATRSSNSPTWNLTIMGQNANSGCTGSNCDGGDLFLSGGDSVGAGENGSIYFPKLLNCDTIDTDGDGLLSCGTDDGIIDYTNIAMENKTNTFTENQTFNANITLPTNSYMCFGNSCIHNNGTHTIWH